MKIILLSLKKHERQNEQCSNDLYAVHLTTNDLSNIKLLSLAYFVLHTWQRVAGNHSFKFISKITSM